MFMDKNFFDEEKEDFHSSRSSRRDRERDRERDRVQYPNALMDEEDFEDGDFGSAGVLPGSSASSRAKVLQQQRELQKRKMQARLEGGGSVRSGGDPSHRTPAVRNFSSPRPVSIDDEPSRFGKDEPLEYDRPRAGRSNSSHRRSSRDHDYEDGGKSNRFGYRDGGRNSRFEGRQYGDDYDDYDDRGGYGSGGGGSNRKKGNRGRGYGRRDEEEDYEYGRRRRASYSSDEDNEQRGRFGDRRNKWDEGNRGSRGGRSSGNSGGNLLAEDFSDEETEDLTEIERDLNARGVSKTFDPTENENEGRSGKSKPLDLSDMKSFLTRPVLKPHGVVECYIERNKSGSNKLFPEYCLYLKDGDRFLLTAKKRPNNKTSNYLISMKRGDLSRNSSNFLGKLRANFIGTEFVVYDNGLNPKELSAEAGSVGQNTIREEVAIVVYASNVLGSRGPRKMKVCVPRVRQDGSRVVFRPTCKDEEMLSKCREQDHTNLTYLINKPPRWNEQVGAYVLNFNGRVTMASVKNFQLVTPDDQETVVLQFGRVGKDLFTMDFRFPLCPFQAFAVTLSSFDSKLACE